MFKRGNLLALLALAVCALAPASAGATGVSWSAYHCNGTVIWNVSPLSGTATATYAPASCLGAAATVDSSTNNSLTTQAWSGGAFTHTFAFRPVVNTTAPSEAFSGAITSTDGGWTGAGEISGVNGGAVANNGAFHGTIVWTQGATFSVDTYEGVGSCGPTCFVTVGNWTMDPLRSV